MIVTICYFVDAIKSVFILVQCNTSLSKYYFAHSTTVVCVIGWIWEEKAGSSALWISVHMKSVTEQEFFPRISIWQQSA